MCNVTSISRNTLAAGGNSLNNLFPLFPIFCIVSLTHNRLQTTMSSVSLTKTPMTYSRS